jgi:hypothetical protein
MDANKNKNTPSFILFLLACFFGSLCIAAAGPVTLTEKTTVYVRQNGKVKPIANAESGKTFTMRRAVAKGKWIEIDYQGKVAYIRSKSTDYKPRDVASVSSTSVSTNSIPLKAGADLNFGTNTLGLGFGARITAELPAMRDATHKLEAVGTFTYFPSVGGLSSVGISSSAMYFGAFGRYGFLINKDIWVGPEAGLVYGIVSISDTSGLGLGLNASSSSILLGAGGYAEGMFTPNLGWLAGLRFFLDSGTSILLNGGVQYYF